MYDNKWHILRLQQGFSRYGDPTNLPRSQALSNEDRNTVALNYRLLSFPMHEETVASYVVSQPDACGETKLNHVAQPIGV